MSNPLILLTTIFACTLILVPSGTRAFFGPQPGSSGNKRFNPVMVRFGKRAGANSGTQTQLDDETLGFIRNMGMSIGHKRAVQPYMVRLGKRGSEPVLVRLGRSAYQPRQWPSIIRLGRRLQPYMVRFGKRSAEEVLDETNPLPYDSDDTINDDVPFAASYLNSPRQIFLIRPFYG